MSKLLRVLVSLAISCSVLYKINDTFNFVTIAIVDNPYVQVDNQQAMSDIPKTTPVEQSIKESKDVKIDYVELFNKDNKLIKVSVEKAVTQQEKERGISNRKYLGTYSGILYVFEQTSLNSLLIKDNLMYLDLIFIDDSNFIVDIKENIPPCNEDFCSIIRVNHMYRYALLVNGNFCRQNDIIIGSSANLYLK